MLFLQWMLTIMSFGRNLIRHLRMMPVSRVRLSSNWRRLRAWRFALNWVQTLLTRAQRWSDILVRLGTIRRMAVLEMSISAACQASRLPIRPNINGNSTKIISWHSSSVKKVSNHKTLVSTLSRWVNLTTVWSNCVTVRKQNCLTWEVTIRLNIFLSSAA